MIRTTDAMMKAVMVQKKKEMLSDNIEAFRKATEAGAHDIASIFADWIEIGKLEVAQAEAMLRNPAA